MFASKQEYKDLYEEAMKFKAVAVEKRIKPDQLIVFNDSEMDLLGFCCLDKNLQFNVYLGFEGLRGYLETVSTEYYLLSRQTCLTLTYKGWSELDSWDCKQLEDLNLVCKASEIWPKFRNLLAGFLPDPITEEKECQFLTRILRQLRLIADQLEGDRFNLVADEVPLCIHTGNDHWLTLKVPLNVFLEQVNNEQFLYANELEAYRIKQLPVTRIKFELAQFYLPHPVKRDKKSRGFFPLVTAVLEAETKHLILGEITDSSEGSQRKLLHNFARLLVNDLKFKPSCLVTDNKTVAAYFEDFCLKTNIQLELVSRLEAAEELMEDLLNQKHESEQPVSGFESDIDLILDTAKRICKKILGSNLLNSKLAEEAKNQFTSIIELIHVVMLGNFKELPDSWTANNVELAYKKILPTLLSEDELKYVPDIIANYVDVVGEAETLPNYREIKQRMDLIKS